MTTARPTARWICLALVAAACSNPADPAQPVQRLHIVATPAATDTITAQPGQALVVEIRNATGTLQPGAVVRFTGLPAEVQPAGPSMQVEAADGSSYGEFVAVTADARGRATVLVQFGSVAGPGRIQISVPESGLADTAGFTILAGAPASILITPKDTTVYAGASIQFSGKVVDRFQNPRHDPVAFAMTILPAGTGSISSTGLLSGATAGLVTVSVTAGTARDTTLVSVVPQGTFAAMDFSAGLIVCGLDGSGYRVLRPQLSEFLEPAWVPDGSELIAALGTDRSFERVPLVGPAVTVTLPPTAGLGAVYWPAVSPDGQFIYFSNVSGGSTGIWRASRDGSQVEGVVGGELFRPSISRDSRYLAYHEAGQNPDGVAVTVFDLLTRTRLANEMPGRFPEWAPTTDLIVAIDGQSRRLVIMGRDGSGRRFLTPVDHGYPDGQLAWSPDGQWILARGPVSLELIHVASGLILPLGFTRSMAEPAWRPGS